MDAAAAKTRLEARRQELAGHLKTLDDTLDQTPSKDWEDRASERQGDEVLESLGHAEMEELRRIDAALGRIAEGTWGECQKCGNDISDARLELLPDTPFCKNCAS
jgi:RNA polymerase-binding transcription factor DksA